MLSFISLHFGSLNLSPSRSETLFTINRVSETVSWFYLYKYTAVTVNNKQSAEKLPVTVSHEASLNHGVLWLGG